MITTILYAIGVLIGMALVWYIIYRCGVFDPTNPNSTRTGRLITYVLLLAMTIIGLSLPFLSTKGITP